MSFFVYKKALEYESSNKLVMQIRDMVSELKNTRPELENCPLADIALKRNKRAVSVTLFFQEQN